MLTHRNFASLVAKLAGAFDFGVGDGLLSVLPLHHTFEFSAGFLIPFSRGAEITYLDELTADRLGEVFETGRVTAMIGVPALWQLLHRKITQELAAQPADRRSRACKALMAAHARAAQPQQHQPGQAALLAGAPQVRRAHQVHGLAAARRCRTRCTRPSTPSASTSPRATASPRPRRCSRCRAPATSALAGHGGQARCPASSCASTTRTPRASARCCAKGPNVMAGYFGDREATDAVLKDGWLHTGDLGRLDAEGQLYLVGRKKDVIIDANGKNVYPDELEELYARARRTSRSCPIVGLPDEAGGEKVACLCVPDYEDAPARRGPARARGALPTGRRADMPFYRRVKVLRFWDGELPRTSTRKVKRKQVVEELRRLERVAASGEKARAQAPTARRRRRDWLYPLIAEVLQQAARPTSARSRARRGPRLRLADARPSCRWRWSRRACRCPRWTTSRSVRDGGGPAQAGAGSPARRRRSRARRRAARADRGARRSARDPGARRRGRRWAGSCSSFGQKVALRRRLRREGHGQALRPAEPELPGRRQPRQPPGHGAGEGGARRAGRAAGRAGRARLLLRHPAQARLLRELHQPHPDGPARLACASRCGWRARRCSRATTCSSSPRARARRTARCASSSRRSATSR